MNKQYFGLRCRFEKTTGRPPTYHYWRLLNSKGQTVLVGGRKKNKKAAENDFDQLKTAVVNVIIERDIEG